MKELQHSFLDKLINHPWLVIFFCLGVSILWAIIACYYPLISLSENQNLYIYSTQAQVLGSVYGLTLTGYVFLRNHQEREMEKDQSLNEIIATIQTKEYCFLIGITILSILAILFDLLTLALYLDELRWLSIATKNAATALFVLSLFLITFFILKALKADKYNQVSKEIIKDVELENIKNYQGGSINDIQENIDDSNNEGYILYGAFMDLFRNIEVNLGLLYDKVYDKGYEMSNLPSFEIDSTLIPRRRPSISRLVKALMDARVFSEGIGPEIKSLIKYRNALVHTNDVDPSQHMVRNAQIVNDEIERILKEYQV